MARLPRLTVPGNPHHLIQRGNNSQLIFSGAADYETLLTLLAENTRKHDVEVHGYVLMGNHFHLLATPATAQGLPRLMQAVARRYVRYFNQRQNRTGTLWEGRYRSAVIQPERYVLPCMVAMDLTPVREGVSASARDYPWSSHAHYIGSRTDKLVSPHPLFWALGNTPFAREAAYADLVGLGVEPQVQQALTDSALRGWALGDPAFVAEIQKLTARRVSKSRPGRPRLASSGDNCPRLNNRLPET